MAQVSAAVTLKTFPVPTQWSVTVHPATPLPATAAPSPEIIPESDTGPRISAVGIGGFGASGARLLSRNLRGVTRFEVTPAPNTGHREQNSSLLSSLQQSDLVFILTEPDDPECAAIARVVGRASCGAGVLTIIIFPLSVDMALPERVTGEERWCHSIFSVSRHSLPSQPDPIIPDGDALSGYAMRHMVAAITTLITHQTGICIDFADVSAIMRSGSEGRMGVGVASGESRAVKAARSAIERLEAQGVSIANASGVLVSIHGSSTLTMDDFDDASRAVHESVAEDANIIVGLISDEQMGYNVKVTVLAVYEPKFGSSQCEKRACSDKTMVTV